MKKILLFPLITLVLTSCDFMSYRNKPEDEVDRATNEWHEANNSHLKPMYGNKQPTEEQQISDNKFIAAMLKDYKDKITSAKKLASRGWYYFFHNKIDTAMFRFNQCWLMDSTYAESYFGFAAIKEYQRLN